MDISKQYLNCSLCSHRIEYENINFCDYCNILFCIPCCHPIVRKCLRYFHHHFFCSDKCSEDYFAREDEICGHDCVLIYNQMNRQDVIM